ncbi:alpha/beta-hydrolase [Amylocystis lapponica]|nr:alpha/beta-hydrolase [Amylocystis lapponica]
MFSAAFIAFISVLPSVLAAPAPLFGINFGEGSSSNSSPSAISQTDITNELLRPALFARTAYCPTDSVANWSCGGSCNALPGVKVYASGGDQGETPFFFVASDPQSKSVVVAHEGTDPSKLLSDLNDVEFKQVAANTTVFPQASSSILLHDGFQKTQGRTSDIILSTVKSALSSTGYNQVLVTGHSLGAAVASLDAVMLRMALPSSVTVESVVFGLPRVGNQDWANLVDSLFPTFTHVTNQDDPVPRVPPQDLNFQHPSGEAHITAVDSGSGDATMLQCPGQENENCADGNSVLDSSVSNHLGPYFSGVSFGGSACQA